MKILNESLESTCREVHMYNEQTRGGKEMLGQRCSGRTGASLPMPHLSVYRPGGTGTGTCSTYDSYMYPSMYVLCYNNIGMCVSVHVAALLRTLVPGTCHVHVVPVGTCSTGT